MGAKIRLFAVIQYFGSFDLQIEPVSVVLYVLMVKELRVRLHAFF